MELLGNNYTIIKETLKDNLFGHRIRYGKKAKLFTQEDHRMCFVPNNEIVVLQRWCGGKYGTTKWVIYIFRTTANDEDSTLLPDVYPKVNLLLFCNGATRVKRTLELVNEIKQQKMNLSNLNDKYWIWQQARLQCGKPLLFPTNKYYAA